MKRLFLELGGKSAAIVFDDADLEGASLIGFGVCMHVGQGCATPTRILLPRSRYHEGVELLKPTLRIGGPGRSPVARHPVRAGHLCSPARPDAGLHPLGLEEGATALDRRRRSPAGLDTGFFVSPTLFVDVDNAMTIAREEIFGLVLVVISYDDDDDALRIANDSAYGLAGFVLSGSLDRSLTVAGRLRAGASACNGGAPYGADLPFGGFKASGVGRQNGYAGFDQYLEVKSVAFPARNVALSRRSRGGRIRRVPRLNARVSGPVQETVESCLRELLDDRVPRRPSRTEERRTERGHPGDHRHRRARREVGMARPRPSDGHAFGADAAEDRERPFDVGDAGFHEFLFAQAPGPQRHDEATVLDEEVVQLTDEPRRELFLVRLLGTTDLHVSLNSSTKFVNGTTSASRNSAAFEPKFRKSRCSATPAFSAISRVVVLR